MSQPSEPSGSPKLYNKLLATISGLGGLLYGIDIGIIAGALLYLDKTIKLTEQQTSLVVAAVLAGSAVSSIVAGAMADWMGRKKMMIVSALLFVLSVGIIYVSNSFVPLLIGRLLQGASGGVIAVVVPLYLAECVPAASRGRSTAMFQFFLTIGIALAALVGKYYINEAEAAIKAANGDEALILAASNHAWRAMFLFVMWPGFVFLAGTFMVAESPRWLYRKGRVDQARAALLKSRTTAEAELEMEEMAEHLRQSKPVDGGTAHPSGSILQRKYVIPFVIACVILGCNQATGINSILQFLTLILKKAGLSAEFASNGDFAVKLLNVIATVIGVVLVDRMGRKFLLKTGTAGIIVSLLIGAAVFFSFESKRVDVSDKVSAAISAQSLSMPVDEATLGAAVDGRPMELAVLFRQGDAEKVVSVFTNDEKPLLEIPAVNDKDGKPLPLEIKRAKYGPVPTEKTGYLVIASLMLFITSFALGPGVCVWLALSELMPTRIRSMGMGVALVINQGVSTGIAAFFLPIVGNFGYSAMFLFWAACTVIYFITAAFFLPETKGKTLEEIEEHFEGKKAKA
jgi:sugar porter (SP) family MFS transporter